MIDLEKRKKYVIVLLALLLMIGFSLTTIISYIVANKSLNTHIRSNILPLVSDNIYSEIQRDVLPTVIISSLMAQDTFVRDWIINGEIEPEQMTHYLAAIQSRYATDTAFFVSEKTHNYYHSTGLIKQVSVTNPLDNWFFRVKTSEDEYEINVDINQASSDKAMTIFVNHKLLDYQGHYLGIIGVGLSSNRIKQLIEHYQQHYNRNVYFVKNDGRIALAINSHTADLNIHQLPGLSNIAQSLLSTPNGSFSVTANDHNLFIESRYIPELDWYLVVEQRDAPEANIQKTLWINLILSSVITCIILFLAHFTLKSYQQRLINMATKDKLTGLDNRHAFDKTFHHSIKLIQRSLTPLSLILIDIDHFKRINDDYGHIGGDSILMQFSALLQSLLRESDIICRWGGEEFIIMVSNCTGANAERLAEQLRAKIISYDFMINDEVVPLSASFGVSEYSHDDNETENQLITRVDSALYNAKRLGRNRVEKA